jgi:hypothetical protein
MLTANALGVSAFGTLTRLLLALLTERRRLIMPTLPTGDLGSKFAVLGANGVIPLL